MCLRAVPHQRDVPDGFATAERCAAADLPCWNRACLTWQLFDRIDQPSGPRDVTSTKGDQLREGIKGDIVVNEVIFAYPTRIEFPVCNGYSIAIKAGQVCALCGPSGSGKSTIINLIERFYGVRAASERGGSARAGLLGWAGLLSFVLCCVVLSCCVLGW
jgi:hypothetical protein